MDILLGAIDYNADGFVREGFLDIDVWTAKHTMLTRLLPFIQSNLNLIELAPQQTGKSYIFGKLCKYGWLAGGGSISRAKLFLDMRPGAKSAGLVTFNDFVAIDEIKSIKFTNDKEMAGILKGYMEDGRVMPSRKDENGIFRDIVHPIDAKTREEFERVILNAYENYIKVEEILNRED